MHVALLCHSDRDLPEPVGLAERVAGGDWAALELLVQLYQPRITRLAHRLLGWSVDDVEDVVQDVFLAAVKSGGRFRRDSSIWTWLSAITINCCRSRQRRRAVIDRVLRAIRRSSYSEAADASAVQDESAREVRAAVSRLAPKDREVVILFYLEHRTIAEMTAILGAKPNAIQVRLHRARARLREQLAAYAED